MRSSESRIIRMNLIQRVREDYLYDLSLTLFLCFTALDFLFYILLRPFGAEEFSRLISLVVVFLPAMFASLQRKKIVVDFWLIWFGVLLFFAVTYIFHPEYELWYKRGEYGVLDYVIRPDNGIYLYLLIRLVKDPRRILNAIRISAWPMYFYYSLLTVKALAQGYWIDTSNRGYEIQLSYNLTLGYSLLLFALAFLYCALENKRAIDWIGAVFGTVLIFLAGSRGPVLDIIIMLVLYALIRIVRSRKKYIILASLTVSGFILYVLYPYLVNGLMSLLNRLNLSSRFLTKLLEGGITDDTGRSAIWQACLRMIEENPLGYGAMGSRHVLHEYIYVAHPHNIFLELLVDFGIVLGAAIIIWLLFWAVKLLLMKNNDAWKGLFLVFFARSCQLLVSGTYLHSMAFWGTIAVGVCMWQAHKEKGTEAYGGQ